MGNSGHTLKPITPLGGAEPKVDAFPGLIITERVDRALASLAGRQGQEAAAASAAQGLLGMALPEAARWSMAGDYMAWWMGPDLWMVDAPHDSHENLAGMIKGVTGDAASVVEQTDGWCRFDVDGSRAVEVFERLCNANLRDAETGAATRASMEHLGVFVLCLDAGKTFAVIGPRSSAGSLHHALVAMAKSVI
ncbi:sarcosine oxidase, gamma subunit [Aliisedimentitalea scapharcae]|uniref:Sarcosine oxidase, gamma subunit n=1 Tax=Aliisedimentitalea scapharcae TaxID=1524259 RepID=A0ABZ2XRG1_9RHOB|nr:sarcosine oxidase, gamma subunit [Rhodobacteraceae bacterium M382]